MLIIRQSMLTGITRAIEIPCTQEQLDAWNQGQDLIQRIMPELTDDQREFMMTGCSPEEWDTLKEDDTDE